MAKTLVEMAAEIVQSRCAGQNMSTDEVTAALQATYKALQALQINEAQVAQGAISPEGVACEETPKVSPEKSIQKNKIICLECGQEFKMLSPKHLRSHDLTGRSYREKWGFSLRQPLCAKALSDRRKKAGKERGLPANLQKAIENRKKKNNKKK